MKGDNTIQVHVPTRGLYTAPLPAFELVMDRFPKSKLVDHMWNVNSGESDSPSRSYFRTFSKTVLAIMALNTGFSWNMQEGCRLDSPSSEGVECYSCGKTWIKECETLPACPGCQFDGNMGAGGDNFQPEPGGWIIDR